MKWAAIVLLAMAACAPAYRAPFKIHCFASYTMQVRITGLGDRNWPANTPQPSPPPNPVTVYPGTPYTFVWDVPPQQVYIDTFHYVNVLALGRDYGPDGFTIRLP